MVKLAPSILAADFARLGEEIKNTEKAGADMIHLDIMDGHFVPNISFGAALSRMSKSMCSLPHDAHFMTTDPENYFDEFIAIGIEYISFHLELGCPRHDLGAGRWVYVADDRPDTTRIIDNIEYLQNAGVKAGLVINPPTEIRLVIPFLGKIDLLLLMAVNPGFAGQAFMPEVYDRLDICSRFRYENGLHFEIMIDGGVDLSNAPRLAKAGADILVSGSSFYRAHDRAAFVRQIKA
jgi:ribulose-phosphate 3-epimerase